VVGKSIRQGEMEKAPANGMEYSNSAHSKGNRMKYNRIE
jgi:hypothetical protein